MYNADLEKKAAARDSEVEGYTNAQTIYDSQIIHGQCIPFLWAERQSKLREENDGKNVRVGI